MTRRKQKQNPDRDLPRGAVRGDPSRQNHGMWGPKKFYLDEEKTCVECGRDFVFGAREQLFWYEELGLTFDAKAIRCKDCRWVRRDDRRLQRRLSEATAATERDPDDASAHLMLAEATVKHIAALGAGSDEVAISAARRAFRLDPSLHAARYWEGRAQEQGSRYHKAIEAYEDFIEVAKHSKQTRKLIEDARQRLAVSHRLR